MSSTPANVVIVGAGFAGIAAARELSGAAAKVTLVDRNVYSTFQPLLYQVATGGLNPGDISYPVRGFTRRRKVAFRRGTMVEVDVENSAVNLDDGAALSYDYLVLATGASVNYFGIPGAAEYGLSLYRRGDAITLRDRLMAALERLASGGIPELSIVVIGGGATGVEMAGTLAELRAGGLAAVYPEVDPSSVRVILIESGPELIAPFEAELRSYARHELERRGVEIRTDTSVVEVAPDHVGLGDGTSLRSDLTVWAAGVTVPDWGLPRVHGGRLEIGEDLRVVGQEKIFAVGDLAGTSKGALPQLAQPAIQEGRHAALQIRRLLSGQPTEPFEYHDKGTMATIGRRAAVVQLPHGVRLRGTLAWFAWLALHIVTLLGNRNRVSALVNLSWRYLNWPRGSGVIVGDLPD